MPLIDHITEFLYCSDCNLNADFPNIVKLLCKFNARESYLRSELTAVTQLLWYLRSTVEFITYFSQNSCPGADTQI